MTETQFIDPAKASSALGKTIARLLQASGLEIELDSFFAIDGIGKTLQSLQTQLNELKDRLSDIEDGAINLDAIDSRLSTLEGDFSNLYDSIPLADRPDLDRCVDLSFS